MTEAVRDLIIDCITGLAVALLSLLAGYAVIFINKAKNKMEVEIKKMTDEREQKAFLSAISNVEKLADNAVKSLEQTTGKELRTAVKNGYLARDALLSLAPQAAAKIYANIKQDNLKTLEKNMRDVSGYIMDLIECKVKDVKSGDDSGKMAKTGEVEDCDGEETVP